MISTASVHSKAMKRGSLKKIAAKLGVEADLRDMVGSLRLDAQQPGDYALLHAIHQNLFSFGSAGKIIVLDKDGKMVMEYWREREKEPAEDAPAISPEA
jgi:hypothetical protein